MCVTWTVLLLSAELHDNQQRCSIVLAREAAELAGIVGAFCTQIAISLKFEVLQRITKLDGTSSETSV